MVVILLVAPTVSHNGCDDNVNLPKYYSQYRDNTIHSANQIYHTTIYPTNLNANKRIAKQRVHNNPTDNYKRRYITRVNISSQVHSSDGSNEPITKEGNYQKSIITVFI